MTTLVYDIQHSRVCGGSNTYCGHPYQDGIFNFGSGEIAVLHKHSPSDYSNSLSIGHDAVHNRAQIIIQRSMDNGDSWQDGYSVIWDESAPLEKRLAFLQSTGPRPDIDLSKPESAIFFGRTRLHEKTTESNQQTFSIRSGDRGRTWEKYPTLIYPPISMGNHVRIYKDAVPLVELEDGYFVSMFYPEGENAPMIYGTGDNGLSWDYLSTGPKDDSGFGRVEYPALLKIPNGEFLLITTNNQGSRNCIQVSHSPNGYDWSDYRSIVSIGKSPWLNTEKIKTSQYQLPGNVYYRSPWPMILRDGRILVIFARRKAPYGIGVIISEDNGSNWSNEEVLRSDSPSSDLGYPVATELDDGRIFVAYYFTDEIGKAFGGPRYIAGTHFRV